jgi:16S rRNA (guanine527-N7)-methyltransferase
MCACRLKRVSPDRGIAAGTFIASDLMDASIQALRPELEQAAHALGLTLGDSQLTGLLRYLDLLKRWNAVYNLTAVREPDRMLRQHLVDCLAVVPALRREQAGRPGGAGLRLLDVGSGGGLPGVVLALVEPDLQVTCVDTVAKKAGFIRQVAAELRLPNLRAAHARVEALDASRPYDFVTSRAFASLPDFVALTRHLLSPGGAWLAMKGTHPDDELAALPPDVEVFHVEPLAVPGLDARRCIVWMRPKGPN